MLFPPLILQKLYSYFPYANIVNYFIITRATFKSPQYFKVHCLYFCLIPPLDLYNHLEIMLIEVFKAVYLTHLFVVQNKLIDIDSYNMSFKQI